MKNLIKTTFIFLIAITFVGCAQMGGKAFESNDTVTADEYYHPVTGVLIHKKTVGTGDGTKSIRSTTRTNRTESQHANTQASNASSYEKHCAKYEGISEKNIPESCKPYVTAAKE